MRQFWGRASGRKAALRGSGSSWANRKPQSLKQAAPAFHAEFDLTITRHLSRSTFLASIPAPASSLC